LEKLHGSIRYNSNHHPFGLLLFNGLIESLLEHSTQVSEEIFQHSQYFLALVNFFHFTSRLKKSQAKFLFGKEIPTALQWLQSQDVIRKSEAQIYFPDAPSNAYSDSEFDVDLQKILIFWNPLNFTGISTSPETLLSGPAVLPPSDKPATTPYEKTISLHWGSNFLGECFTTSETLQQSSQFSFVEMPNSSETVFGGNVNVKDAQSGNMFAAVLFENGELWGAGMVPPGSRKIGVNSKQPDLENKKAIKMWAKVNYLFVQTEDKTIYEFGSNAIPRKLPIPNEPEYAEVVEISEGDGHFLILFASGKVLGWGRNQNHQLLMAEPRVENMVELPTPPNDKVIQLEARRDLSGFLCESGALYIFGKFSRCLGQGHIGELELYDLDDRADPDWTEFKKIAFPGDAKIKQFSIGLCHLLALTQEGKVYAWGNNTYGQLGIGSTTPQSFPRLISFLNDENIISVSAGSDLSYAVTKSGKVYGWGEATFGQLATFAHKLSSIPRLITAFPVSCKVLKVQIGRQRIAAVATVATSEKPAELHTAKVIVKKSLSETENNNNNNAVNQLFASVPQDSYGVPHKILHWGFLEHGFPCCWKEPLILPALNPFAGFEATEVAQGKCHLLALNAQGRVFSFGQGTQGALGLGHTASVTKQLAPIKFLNDKVVTSICCGSHHSVAITNTGQVYSWGGGMPVDNLDDIQFLEEYNIGQLGHGDTFMRTVPLMIKSLAGVKITQVSCGDWHTAALSESGDLYTWGQNTNGRLGFPLDVQYGTTPKKIAQDSTGRIAQVACGKDFTCVVNREGQVFTWGAGNCGQLGNGNTQDSWEPVRVTDLDLVRVSKVACGRSHVIALAVVSATPLTLTELTSRYILRKLQLFHSKLQSIPSDVIPIIEQQVEKHLTQAYQHQLYAWGLAERGQLGTGEFAASSAVRKQLGFMKMRQQYPQGHFISKPQLVQTDKFPPNFQVKDIQCGYYHSICLMDDGSLFTWGEGTAGQTGLGHLESKDTPEPVALPEGKWIVKKIAAKFLVSNAIAGDFANFKLSNVQQTSSAVDNNNNRSTNTPQESSGACYSLDSELVNRQ